MKISKVLSVVFVFAFFTSQLHAQLKFSMPKYKEVLQAKGRQPVVIINPPNPDKMAKLAKRGTDGAMQLYQSSIGDYNTFMKDAVTKFWNFNSKPVLYKTRDEIKEMLNDKSQRDQYIFIYCCDYQDEKHDLDWNVDSKGKEISGTRPIFEVSLSLGDYPIFQMPFDGLLPTPVTMSYYVSKTNSIFNYLVALQNDCKMPDMIIKNSPLLSKKTLLILNGSVNKDYIDNIKTYYPCNFKLVDNVELYKAVESGDPAYAYIITTGYGAPLVFMNWVINCEDGAPLAYTDWGKPAAFAVIKNGFDKDFFIDIGKFCSGTMKK